MLQRPSRRGALPLRDVIFRVLDKVDNHAVGVTVTHGMTASHYSFHLRTMWSSIPETVPIGVDTPASKRYLDYH